MNGGTVMAMLPAPSRTARLACGQVQPRSVFISISWSGGWLAGVSVDDFERGGEGFAGDEPVDMLAGSELDKCIEQFGHLGAVHVAVGCDVGGVDGFRVGGEGRDQAVHWSPSDVSPSAASALSV